MTTPDGPSLASRIAATLRAHEYNGAECERPHYRRLEHCVCGWQSTFQHREHTDHVAALLCALFEAGQPVDALSASVGGSDTRDGIFGALGASGTAEEEQ